MSAGVVALRAGVERGRIELRQSVTSVQDWWGALFIPAISLTVMYLLRGTAVPGTDFSLGSQAVPGILGLNLVLTGLTSLALALITDREDGTLMRVKAVPNGVLGYLVGRVLGRAGMAVASTLVVLLPAAVLFDGLQLGAPSSWLTLAWVLVLGLLATLPLGVALGSLFSNVQALSIIQLPIMVLMAVSGIFYPLVAFPTWLQWVAQAFPIYWLGLGMRSALLPDALAVAEVGGSWRHVETAVALGAWVVLGFVVAPMVLRRMAGR